MLDNIAKTSYRALAASQYPVEACHITLNDGSPLPPDDLCTSTSYTANETSHHPEDNSLENSINPSTTPVRPRKRALVIPNTPRISRRRIMNVRQFSTARRNIFYFVVNEEKCTRK